MDAACGACSHVFSSSCLVQGSSNWGQFQKSKQDRMCLTKCFLGQNHCLLPCSLQYGLSLPFPLSYWVKKIASLLNLIKQAHWHLFGDLEYTQKATRALFWFDIKSQLNLPQSLCCPGNCSLLREHGGVIAQKGLGGERELIKEFFPVLTATAAMSDSGGELEESPPPGPPDTVMGLGLGCCEVAIHITITSLTPVHQKYWQQIVFWISRW